MSFICPISFENLLPRSTFSWFCFVCGTVTLVFICDYHKCRRRSEPYFLSSGWMSHSFSICGLPHISFHFPVELSHLTFCDCRTRLFQFFQSYKPSWFIFIFLLYPYHGTIIGALCYSSTLLCSADRSTFLCVNVTQISCVHIIFVWMSHMYVSIFFVWMSQKYPCVSITSKWTLHFVSFWVISELFPFLSSVNYHTSFLKWKTPLVLPLFSFLVIWGFYLQQLFMLQM